MIAITNSPSENQTHRGVVSCDRCFIASSQPGRTIQVQALDSRNCARLLGCRGICPHRRKSPLVYGSVKLSRGGQIDAGGAPLPPPVGAPGYAPIMAPRCSSENTCA